MKRVFVFVFACVFLTACNRMVTGDNGKERAPVETRSYAVDGPYHELEVGRAFSVVMSDTVAEPSVSIAADLHERVIFRIEEGTLVIGLKPGRYGNLDEALVLLPYNPQLDEVELGGASHFSCNLPLVAAEVSISLSGASTFEGMVNASHELDIEAGGASHITAEIQVPTGNVDIELGGASSATLRGTTNVLDMDVSGASNLNAVSLDAASVRGEVGGASQADVLCCQSIAVDVSGVSHLTYGLVGDGCAPTVNCRTSGASTVSRR